MDVGGRKINLVNRLSCFVFQTTELGWIIRSCKFLLPSPLGSWGNVCGHKSILWSHSCWQLCWDDLVAQRYSINMVILGSYCVSALAGHLVLLPCDKHRKIQFYLTLPLKTMQIDTSYRVACKVMLTESRVFQICEQTLPTVMKR